MKTLTITKNIPKRKTITYKNFLSAVSKETKISQKNLDAFLKKYHEILLFMLQFENVSLGGLGKYVVKTINRKIVRDFNGDFHKNVKYEKIYFVKKNIEKKEL